MTACQEPLTCCKCRVMLKPFCQKNCDLFFRKGLILLFESLASGFFSGINFFLGGGCFNRRVVSGNGCPNVTHRVVAAQLTVGELLKSEGDQVAKIGG